MYVHLPTFHWLTQVWNPAGIIQIVPPLLWPWEWYYVGLLGLCALVVGFSFLPRLPKLLAHPLRKVLFNNFWAGILLLFLRTERVPILGMDIWRLAQECAIVISVFLIVRHFRATHPHLVLRARVEEYRTRFLPKPNVRP